MSIQVEVLLGQAALDGVRLELSDSDRVKAVGESGAIERWLPALRERKDEIVEAMTVGSRSPTREDVQDALKGQAVLVVLDGTGERCWLVADENDAGKLGESRGSIYTRDEIRILTAIRDLDLVEELRAFKRNLPGALTLGDRRKDIKAFTRS